MTVVIKVGRRLPRRWFKRQAGKAIGLISFQQNIWMMVSQALSLAKRKANASGKIDFVMSKESEIEDLNYELEWLVIIIRGTKEQEEEEYNEALAMYEPVGKVFKKEMPKDENMMKHFKTKMLSTVKVEEAYKKGYGSIGDNNIANKLLEMGILTHIEKIEDFETRECEIKTDF